MLDWYSSSGRTLPWRQKTKRHSSPYHVWISEIMLQQTTVSTVIPYFNKFIVRWPTLNDFAEASLDAVLHMWQGLGYYSRARNLYRGAHFIVNHFKGQFPQEYDDLLKVPGIGTYTAAAIASIAYYQPIIPIDGNIIRVFSRLMGLDQSVESLKKNLPTLIEPISDPTCSGDLTQALMDLGAMVCIPRNPKCSICPVQIICYAHQTNQVALYPQPKVKLNLLLRTGQAWLIRSPSNKIILTKRPSTGLLANLWEPPTFGWDNTDSQIPPFMINYTVTHLKPIHHTFTHFKLMLNVKTIVLELSDIPADLPNNWQWIKFPDIEKYALSTLAKKIIAQL